MTRALPTCVQLATLCLAACSSSTSDSRAETGGSTSSGGGGSSVPLVIVPPADGEFSLPTPEGLAVTPPMGWNSWNSYGSSVSAALIRLTLLATGAGDGITGDRVDWADAKVDCSP